MNNLFRYSVLTLTLSLISQPIRAQITPANDPTQTVVNEGNGQFQITGGTRSSDGTNLFHSFEQFGLNTGQIANFLSDPNIKNIIGRVVGNQHSMIDGLVQVIGGNSNLFLMNPNGIIFGPNAQLNLPGSFTATTANRIGFSNDQWWGTNTNNIAVNGTPIQFVFDMTSPNPIINQGRLSVLPGQNLNLIGGSIINSGQINGGTIVISAVPGEHLVRISQPGQILSLEVEPSKLAEGIKPVDIPKLITGTDESKPRIVLGNLQGVDNQISGDQTGYISPYTNNGVIQSDSGLVWVNAPDIGSGSITINGQKITPPIPQTQSNNPIVVAEALEQLWDELTSDKSNLSTELAQDQLDGNQLDFVTQFLIEQAQTLFTQEEFNSNIGTVSPNDFLRAITNNNNLTLTNPDNFNSSISRAVESNKIGDAPFMPNIPPKLEKLGDNTIIIGSIPLKPDGEVKESGLTNQLARANLSNSSRFSSLPPLRDAAPMIPMLENNVMETFKSYYGTFNQQVVTLKDAQEIIKSAQKQTGIHSGIIYAFFKPEGVDTVEEFWRFNPRNSGKFSDSNPNPQPTDQLELVLVTTKGLVLRYRIPEATRERVMLTTQEFLYQVTNQRNQDYQIPSQRLYKWILEPLERDLKSQQINNLVFIVDTGLRSIPFAALHDGTGFIVERYSLGLTPSLSLTDTRYVDVRQKKILAMGASKFKDHSPLPAVPVELATLANRIWSGQKLLNEQFTLKNIQKARSNQSHGIVHLATHGEFNPGKPDKSYIQLSDRRLTLDQLSQLRLSNPPVDLLVLSACRTALGDKEAELGFAGLAVLAGVKSAIGSLWYVSDHGTLGLMTTFYDHLNKVPVKAEALRQAQLAMIKGQVKIVGGELVTPTMKLPLPPELQSLSDRDFSHPYFWSAFTMIGNPW